MELALANVGIQIIAHPPRPVMRDRELGVDTSNLFLRASQEHPHKPPGP